MGREGDSGSDAAEHMAVCSHVVVPVEQLSCEGFIIEVVGVITHHLFEIIALFDDVSGEVFFYVSLAAVGFLAKPSAAR